MQETVYIFLGSLVLLFLLIVMAYFLITMDRSKLMNAKYIQANWIREGTSPSTGEKWLFSYRFSQNQVFIKGVNPEFSASANYTIVKEDESFLALQLSNIVGDLESNQRVLKLGIDKPNKQLYINNRLYKQAQA